MAEPITLVRMAGPTSVRIEVEIKDNGDLVISGQDFGEGPREFFGDSEYEYWLTVRAAHKDRLLLALVEKLYTGNAEVVSQLRHYLESKEIPCEFFCC